MRRQRGAALLIVLVMISVMAVLVMANSAALHGLRKFLDQTEVQQNARLNRPAK